jgi:hypothetical protein
MARRGREAALKRAREKARQEKREAKRERRQEKSSDESATSGVDEDALMEEFARISALHKANEISTAQYNTERHRIFGELGIESED